MTRYVALLRGINVGGKNLIRMTDLKACLEQQGLHDVVTYIQSGNVLFSSDASAKELAGELEQTLARTFNYRASLVLRTRKQMEETVRRAPAGFGEDPERYRYDVLFLKEPLTARAAIARVPLNEGVDCVHAGPGALYFSRLISRASQSQLSRVASMPMYQSMTIRNWNTTTKLTELLKASDCRKS